MEENACPEVIQPPQTANHKGRISKTSPPPRAVEKKDCPLSFEDFAGATANDILIDTAWKCRVCQLLPAFSYWMPANRTSTTRTVEVIARTVPFVIMGLASVYCGETSSRYKTSTE